MNTRLVGVTSASTRRSAAVRQRSPVNRLDVVLQAPSAMLTTPELLHYVLLSFCITLLLFYACESVEAMCARQVNENLALLLR
jgi:hypothetical protein